MSCRAVPYRVVSCRVVSCHVMSCHVMVCALVIDRRGETTHSGVDVNNTHLSMINPLIISYHIISYHIISYHIIYYLIYSYLILSYHHIIISFHIISYHVTSYHIVSSYHPDLNHHMEFFMGVQPTKLGIIPDPTSKGIDYVTMPHPDTSWR